MPEKILIYESPEVTWMGPPAATRPVWTLRLGPFTSEILLRRALPGAEIAGWARPSMEPLAPRPGGECFAAGELLLVDARLLPVNDRLAEALADLKRGQCLSAGGCDYALRLAAPEAGEFLRSLDGEDPVTQPDAEPLKTPFGALLRFWWELPGAAAGLLLARWETALELSGARRSGEGELYLAPGAALQPDVAVAGGPVLVDREAQVEARSFLGAPCYLGPGTRVRPQARLLHGVIAGPQCRLGGEIEESLLLGYANKQHDGFLGHAVLGEWVNLGAGCNNSDLKNNYSSVRVRYRGRDFDTGRTFVGCCLGDHSKVAIGGRLNTGTVMGAFCNWFGAGFPDKELPDFSWGDDRGLVRHDPERALATARSVMARRDRELTPELERVYRSLLLEADQAPPSSTMGK